MRAVVQQRVAPGARTWLFGHAHDFYEKDRAGLFFARRNGFNMAARATAILIRCLALSVALSYSFMCTQVSFGRLYTWERRQLL